MINLQNSDTGPAFPPPLEPGVNPGVGPLLPVGLPLPRRPWKRKRGKRAGFFVQLRKILRGDALPDRCSAAVLWRIQQKLNGVGLISLLNGAPDAGRYLKAWETKNLRRRSLESLRSLARQPPAIIEPAAHTSPDSSAKMMLINARSIANKSHILNDLFRTKKLNFLWISESWQRENDVTHLRELCPQDCSSLLHGPQAVDLLSSTIKLDRIIIGRDFNIHAEDLSNSSTREFLNMMNSFNFSQHVSGPTHRAGHTLDLVFSYGLLVDKLQINDVVFSDHKSVSFHINLNSESLLPVSAKQRRIINSSTILNFSSLFDFVPPSSDDVELLTNSFNDHCLKILDQVAPYKTSRSSSASSSPWLNNQILELRRSYRKAERRWKRTGLVVHREYFKELLESYNEAVENARSSFFSNLICQNKNNPKVLFDTISSIISSPPQ
uniref:Endonuclease/exonuclease/phosphatase domain-containing protein n=1 Tax=Nothobranchius pienaari TaxID=704102 RepID=A0A1A8LCV6_9TELE